jgi:hypothetical protein
LQINNLEENSMTQPTIRYPVAAATLALALAIPAGAFAYDADSAIKDCEKRLKDEYGLKDFRHQEAETLPGGGHKYNVKGMTKIDDKKYPFSCEVRDRHVTSIKYSGPEPEGMSTAGKVAVGAAAAAATAAAVTAMTKEEKIEPTPTGLKACRAAVHNKSEYRGVSESDIFVTAKHQDEANVEWRIETDKLDDWGTCQVSADDQVIAVRTKQHQTK